jgi:hypothetical protein
MFEQRLILLHREFIGVKAKGKIFIQMLKGGIRDF